MADLDVHIPGYVAAQLTGVSRQLVHSWRRSGRLPVAAYDKHGRPLYRYGDVLKAERATRSSPRSSRHIPPGLRFASCAG